MSDAYGAKDGVARASGERSEGLAVSERQRGLAASGMTAFPSTAALRTGTWQVRAASTAQFEVRNLGVKTVRGTLPIRAGSVEVDARGRPAAVHAVVDVAGIDTGNARRDRDLRKPGLLDLDQHPTLMFVAPTPVPTESGWRVAGEISARGAIVSIELDVRVSWSVDSASVIATGVFDRRSLGIRAPRFMIGRHIRIRIDATLDEPS